MLSEYQIIPVEVAKAAAGVRFVPERRSPGPELGKFITEAYTEAICVEADVLGGIERWEEGWAYNVSIHGLSRRRLRPELDKH